MNSSQVSFFTFSAYYDIGLFKYLLFTIVMCFYILILCANVFLIVVICMNRSLHEPMYIFLCSLFMNELYGSTGLYPLLLIQIFSDIHTVSAPFCYLQIFCLYTYANVEFYTLAVMSYDRYLSICCPLQYNTLMTSNKVAMLIALSWLFPFLAIVIMISLNASLQLCGNIIDRLYCDNYSLVKLACYDTTVNNVYGLIYTFIVLFGLVVLIIYTYIRILKVCFSGSKQTRRKAVSTCTPHLTSLFNFSVGCLFEIVQSRLNMSRAPMILRIFLSLYFIIFQPLCNPVVYGLNLSKIHILCRVQVVQECLGYVYNLLKNGHLKHRT
ncbi:olfactory receptor 10J5-like [Larimichthys crocea]|uniref:olfactory receptor 10J5-like n=1 Tax=Larimichthys crocea TaxID=215358 RepID=UPI000F5F71EE|nr:olfactory receptor 10J5-like [Larimichthys crocea]